jgi:hypothetical protein
MQIEFELNRCTYWWFDLGISFQKTEFHPSKKWVFTLALGLVTLYVRW